MNKEDVIYNIRLSFDFYFREVFCKKYGFYETKEKKIQKVLKNKKYKLEEGILLTDGNGNAEPNIYVSSDSNSNSDFVFDYASNSIYFTSQKQNVTITYNVINVDIVDSYPYDKSDDFEKQMIAISFDNIYCKPFDVCGKIQRWEIPFYIDLFLFNKVIRDRISCAIGVMLKSVSIPIIDFINNGIINKDGSFNYDFSFEKNSISYVDKFGDIKIDSTDMESLDKKKMYSCTVEGEIVVNF